ncbi:MAG: DUF2516 family protein [Acidimicrobiia bacterium]|nr:DUF2516 family protein [Acidimicrobiia bacterium]
MNIGATEMLIVLLIVSVGLGIPIWAIVHAAATPDSTWNAFGSSRAMWITLIVVGLFLSPVGFILSIVYLAAIRPKLNRAAALAARESADRESTVS